MRDRPLTEKEKRQQQKNVATALEKNLVTQLDGMTDAEQQVYFAERLEKLRNDLPDGSPSPPGDNGGPASGTSGGSRKKRTKSRRASKRSLKKNKKQSGGTRKHKKSNKKSNRKRLRY
jgi:hypothetical protein